MKNYKVNTTVSADKENIEILLSGDLTLKNSAGFYEQLKNVKQSYKHYSLILKDVNRIDISCLQIILAFNLLIKKNKKEVSIRTEVNEEIEKLIFNARLIN